MKSHAFSRGGSNFNRNKQEAQEQRGEGGLPPLAAERIMPQPSDLVHLHIPGAPERPSLDSCVSNAGVPPLPPITLLHCTHHHPHFCPCFASCLLSVSSSRRQAPPRQGPSRALLGPPSWSRASCRRASQ